MQFYTWPRVRWSAQFDVPWSLVESTRSRLATNFHRPSFTCSSTPGRQSTDRPAWGCTAPLAASSSTEPWWQRSDDAKTVCRSSSVTPVCSVARRQSCELRLPTGVDCASSSWWSYLGLGLVSPSTFSRGWSQPGRDLTRLSTTHNHRLQDGSDRHQLFSRFIIQLPTVVAEEDWFSHCTSIVRLSACLSVLHVCITKVKKVGAMSFEIQRSTVKILRFWKRRFHQLLGSVT